MPGHYLYADDKILEYYAYADNILDAELTVAVCFCCLHVMDYVKNINYLLEIISLKFQKYLYDIGKSKRDNFFYIKR
ncbi:hypothetical protein FACS189413_04930 [Bacteroidia bacterium]|nr:hypothetical protein FACS189413_04930 [Bacteroidia bacterium]